MARALARGFVEKHRVAAASISAYDPHQTALDEFTQLIPAATRHDSNQALMAAADIIFLAVKPQYVEDVHPGSQTKSVRRQTHCFNRRGRDV